MGVGALPTPVYIIIANKKGYEDMDKLQLLKRLRQVNDDLQVLERLFENEGSIKDADSTALEQAYREVFGVEY